MASTPRDNIREVSFYLMSDVNAKRPQKISKITLTGCENWEVLRDVFYRFGSAEVFLFDPKSGGAKKFVASDTDQAYFVTEKAYFTPSGNPSKHAYWYQSNWYDIREGDIVSVEGKDGKFCVESGNGGSKRNPELLVRERDRPDASTFVVVASKLTFVERGLYTPKQNSSTKWSFVSSFIRKQPQAPDVEEVPLMEEFVTLDLEPAAEEILPRSLASLSRELEGHRR